MATVTYKNQPAIHKTRGSVPLAGTEHLYTVGKVLWPKAVEAWIAARLIGTTLHIASGHSQLGDLRLDFDRQVWPDVQADAARVPFADQSFDTVLCDPPYNGKFQWNHDMLNELHRLARRRIIFQHWFSPVNKRGQFKKAHVFELVDTALVNLPAEGLFFFGYAWIAMQVDGKLYMVRDDPKSYLFELGETVYWQPRTYFGRAQIISVLDRRYEPIS